MFKNPSEIRVGDKIVLRRDNTGKITKTRTVKKIAGCGKAECIHIDHECYDMRFSRVDVA